MLTISPRPTPQRNEVDHVGRQTLLLANLIEVQFIAKRMHRRMPSHVSFEDLFHAGILGLIDAIDRFDPQKNVALKSYARFRIRGAILDSLRQMDWSPRNLRRQARRLEEASHDLIGELGHAPSSSEMASKLRLPIEDLQHLLGELGGLVLESLQTPCGERSGEESLPIASRPEEDPFQMTLRQEVRQLLEDALWKLGAKEREVLGLYYFQEVPMKKIGKILGIGESRVSQVHAAALVHLRSRLLLFQRGRLALATTTLANGRARTSIDGLTAGNIFF
jgi:RNA polymerase sigma factor FliA